MSRTALIRLRPHRGRIGCGLPWQLNYQLTKYNRTRYRQPHAVMTVIHIIVATRVCEGPTNGALRLSWHWFWWSWMDICKCCGWLLVALTLPGANNSADTVIVHCKRSPGDFNTRLLILPIYSHCWNRSVVYWQINWLLHLGYQHRIACQSLPGSRWKRGLLRWWVIARYNYAVQLLHRIFQAWVVWYRASMLSVCRSLRRLDGGFQDALTRYDFYSDYLIAL